MNCILRMVDLFIYFFIYFYFFRHGSPVSREELLFRGPWKPRNAEKEQRS